ncbi:MAG: MerR family transcriptional regulator [Bullifex sp.]
MSEKKYKVGQLAEAAGLTVRTIRYYDEMGLLKSTERTSGGQRVYSDTDLVYIKRIMELKSLSFSLEEIRKIILLSGEDRSGEKRRQVLLEQYREKLRESEEKARVLGEHISELRWHIRQLEGASDSFQECPGALCENCSFKKNCSFAK